MAIDFANVRLNNCRKLGNCLHFERPLEKYIEKASYIIKKDFNLNQMYLKGLPIVAQKDNPKDPEFYSYTHILKLNEKKISDDRKRIRAKIAPQIKRFINLINNDECCENLLIWKQTDQLSNNKKLFILCKDVRLMIIFIIRKNYYILRTAYYVDDNGSLNYYLNQYRWSEKGI